MCGVLIGGVCVSYFKASSGSVDDASIQRYAFSYANILQEENVL